jgi:hypothetical protein
MRDLARWNGVSWEQVGAGIQGGFGGISDLEILQNYLFITGYFFKSDGNAGNHMMYWDGSSFHEFLFGVESTNGIYDMDVVNDTMYITGLFRIPPDTLTYAVARYDGTNFCLYRGHNAQVISVEKYNNDIIIATDWVVDGDTTNFIGRWIGGAPDTCIQLVLGENEILFEKQLQLQIFPNPTDGNINLVFETLLAADVTIELVDVAGKIISVQNIKSVQGLNKTSLNTETLSTGIYFVKVSMNGMNKAVKFIKQ